MGSWEGPGRVQNSEPIAFSFVSSEPQALTWKMETKDHVSGYHKNEK